MMPRRRELLALVLLTLLPLAGCLPPDPETSPADEAIARWVGQPVERVIASWGEPLEKRQEEGRTVYVWPASHYDSRYYPANLPPTNRPLSVPAGEELSCKGVVVADEEGIVTRAEWQGYECTFLP